MLFKISGMPKKIFSAVIICFFAFYATAQQLDKDELERQREQIKKEISETEKALLENQKTTKLSVGQLSLINRKLDLQDNIISNLSGEIRSLNDNIYLSQLEINKIQRVLDTLKVEYAKSMVYAYKNRNNYDFLNFIFSANNFNDAIKRIAYLKSYRNYREIQAENIIKTQAMLEEKIQILSGNKKVKNEVLKEKDQELTKLQKQQQEKARIVDKLKGQKKELLAQIKAKRSQDLKVRNAINAMIKREIALANEKKEKEKNKANAAAATTAPKSNNASKAPSTAPSSGSILVSSEADIALNASFEKNKGLLPWPADGFVIYKFGTNKFPDGIDYESPGVSIGTKVGQAVKAVFDGEVTRVSYVDDKQVVFIKHGKYFTVYSNLATSSVKSGDKVRTGQAIGTTAANEDGQGELDFILMKESSNVNPQLWLHR